jgi:hypothetical protein
MGFFSDAWDTVTDIGHAVTGIPTADEKRNAQKLIRDQVNAYKEMSEISKQEIASKKNELAVEKRRVDEKQIRSLRRNYRPQGIMGAAGTSSTTIEPGMSQKLGG